MSGVTEFINLRNALESIANNSLSINFLILTLSVSPSTSIIECLYRVVSSADGFFNFAKPFSSASILFCKRCVNNWILIVLFDTGNWYTNASSFSDASQSISFSTNFVKSIDYDSSLPDGVITVIS